MTGARSELKVKTDIVLREEDDGAFLFDPNTGRICFLNEIGSTVWKFCSKISTPEEIINRLSSEFPDIPKKRITDDCIKFLEELRGFGFLVD